MLKIYLIYFDELQKGFVSAEFLIRFIPVKDKCQDYLLCIHLITTDKVSNVQRPVWLFRNIEIYYTKF